MPERINVPEAELELNALAAQRIKAKLASRTFTYYIETYGCQMNEHDSEKLAGLLETCGMTRAAEKNVADMIVFNTCCVRDHAEKRLMGNVGALKKLKDERPGLIICICGCMTQQKAVADKLFKRFPYVDLIFGTNELHMTPSMLEDVLAGRRIERVRNMDGEIAEGLPVLRNKDVSQFVTIMYGCNNFCSYCIVPYVRGRERSREPAKIVAEIETLASSGVREITLLGQNVNSYDGGDGTDFAALLKLCAQIDKIERIRFMTSHPKDLSGRLIEAMATTPKVCPHIHLPVQSGSDRILAQMNRHYDRKRYMYIVKELRGRVNGVEITTDIIVGFPGETDEDFAQTLSLVEEVGFAAAYTFKYSQRTGTTAADMPDQIPDAIKRKRLKMLNDTVEAGLRAGNEKYVGTTGEVLVEGCDRRGEAMAFGKLPCFKMVYFPGDEALIGKTVPVNIKGVASNSLIGEMVK